MISEHISIEEATKSNTAIRKEISNAPNAEQLDAMRLLSEKVFEPLRAWYGKPIKISSFFRSSLLNEAIGGAGNSQHCKGEAMDIDAGKDNAELFLRLKNNSVFDQLIWEFGNDRCPSWVHVSYRKEGNRKEVLKAVKENGKTVYLRY